MLVASEDTHNYPDRTVVGHLPKQTAQNTAGRPAGKHVVRPHCPVAGSNQRRSSYLRTFV